MYASPALFFVHTSGQEHQRRIRPCCVRHRWSVDQDESAGCEELLQHRIVLLRKQGGIRLQRTGDVRCGLSLRQHLDYRSGGCERLVGVEPIFPGRGNCSSSRRVPHHWRCGVPNQREVTHTLPREVQAKGQGLLQLPPQSAAGEDRAVVRYPRVNVGHSVEAPRCGVCRPD